MISRGALILDSALIQQWLLQLKAVSRMLASTERLQLVGPKVSLAAGKKGSSDCRLVASEPGWRQ